MMENPLEVFKRGFYYEINSLPRLRVSLASQMLVFNLKKKRTFILVINFFSWNIRFWNLYKCGVNYQR
jgi:hypothetical protein